MSFRLKFFITIIGLLTIIGAAIPLLSKSSQYITINQFNNDTTVEKEDGKIFIIGGKISIANDIGLSKLFVDNDGNVEAKEKNRHAVFNLIDTKKPELYVKIIYDAHKNDNVEFKEGTDVIVTGQYFKEYKYDKIIGKSILNDVIVCSSLQTKCDSKYTDQTSVSESQ